MAFSLQTGPIDYMVFEQDAAPLKAWLETAGITYVEQFDPAPFSLEPLFTVEELDESEGGPGTSASHDDAGWSWWSLVQKLAADTIGEHRSSTVQYLHAFYGVAIPAEIENSLLGEPRRREMPDARPKSSWIKQLNPFAKKEVFTPEGYFAGEVYRLGSPFKNLVMVSAPQLLRELEETAQKLSLNVEELEDLWDEVDDEDEDAAKAFLLLCIKFIRATMEVRALCWFIK